MRRFLLSAGLLLALIATAAPVAAAETFHFRAQGNWASAFFSNVVYDENGALPPGDYFYTDIWASKSIQTGDATYEDSGVCVFNQTFSVDGDGNWIDTGFIGACGPADLAFARRLASGSIAASLPVEECLAWNDQTGECEEVVNLGTIAVDLTLTGVGPLYRYHGTSTGGTAGFYQYSSHGTGTSREATPTGTVTLTASDGTVTDLTGGATGFGWMSQSRDGYVDVIVKG